MFRLSIILFFVLSARPMVANARPSESLSARTVDQLEAHLQDINDELETLAHLSLRSDSGSIGYYSTSYYTGDHHEWVEIDLGHLQTIDEVVIVPVLRRYSKVEFKADGLPDKLLIRAGTPEDSTGQIIASLDTHLPRIAPLIVSMPQIQASWIRIEAPHLNKRGVDGRYTFQLSEVFVFSGLENIALHCPVTASTASTGHSDAWKPCFLVDGHTPYIMDTARGKKTTPFIRLGAAPPTLTIDLQQPQTISSLHLHAVDQSAMVPQAHFSDFGMPRHLLIEGALQPDFSDARPLLEHRQKSNMETGPIMMWNFPRTLCRYVRITAPTPKPDLRLPPVHRSSLSRSMAPELRPLTADSSIFRIAFSEIELLSNGKNVALNKPVISTHLPCKIWGHISALTDGSNLYGELLPLREWMQQLARRHDLETRRPFIQAELDQRILQQRTNLRWMYWTSGLLACITFAGLFIARKMHHRELKNIKKRIAADLHDELGANLHAIGLIGDLAKMEVQKGQQSHPETLIKYLDEVKTLSENSGSSTRYVSHMLDAESYHEHLIAEMKHAAGRYLADVEHQSTFPSEKAIEPLTPQQRIDLFLFYKEALTNIIRHSEASKVHITLQRSGQHLCLIIKDDGVGLAGHTPPSLKRRAQLMHAKLQTDRSPVQGTTICLTVRIKKRRLCKLSRGEATS